MSGVVSRTIMWLAMRQMFVRQRMIAAFIVALIPIAVMAIALTTSPAITAMKTAGNEVGSAMLAGRFLMSMYKDFVIGTLLPLVAILFGSTAFGAEVNDGTIVYLLAKPESRLRIIVSKFLVAAAATVLVMAPAVYGPWLLMNHEQFPASVPAIVLGAIAVGAFLYNALFIAVGISSKRALVMGLLYIVVIEFVLSKQAAGVMSFSIREFTITALSKLGEGNRWFGPGNITIETVRTMAPIFFFGSLAFAWNKFRKFEISEKL
jgi:ABC-2 type transport system permease protein